MQPAENNQPELKFGVLIRVGDASPLPLLGTAITGAITGSIASVAVTQTFSNPFQEIIELSYLFPLPHEAAIVDYEIQIGGRTIKAEMKEIEAARKAYQDAVEAGHAASVLEQRRPNLFSVQVGNVAPGTTIITTIRYQERLHYADDSYTFVFPMGVTPKYHADPSQAAQTDSPTARPGEKIGGVTLTLSVDAGVAVGDPSSPSHSMQTARQDERRFTVMLPADTLPNKDFVLRYSVASGAVQPVAWVSAEAGVETMLLTLLPPRLTDDIAPEPREFIFVVDRSGSMNGGPLEQAKNALRACLRAMNPTDSFTIQAFDDKIEWFDPRPQSVTQETVNRADKWLDTIHSRGGTEIVPAITAALSISADAARQRYVVFLTDGAVSAEEQAQANVKKLRGTARLFTFGIGSSVNRALLAKMAEVGRGIAEFLQLHEDIETAITRFQDRVSYPVLQDLVLEWQNAETWDVYPATLPDLYVGQALELVARLKRKDASADVTLHVTGKRRGQPVTVNAAIPITTYTDPALTRVWARARVDALMDQPHSDSTRQQIISLAIDHRLVTPFTAFVAVDSETVQNADGSPRKVAVSVPLPEGVDFDTKVRGVFGFAASTPLSSIVLGGRSMPVAPAPAGMPRAKSPLPDIDVPSFLRRVVSSVRPDAKKRADTNQLSKMMPPPADEEMMLEEAADTPLLTSIPEIIKWLARTQNLSGSWGGGADEAEQTAAALLAFVRAGHTTRAGNYRAQVRKAADWLKAATLTGFAAALRWRALHELDTAQNTTAYAFPAPQPNSDAERAALDDSAAITLPAQVTTLDGLRITAIRAGAATPEDALLNDHAQQALIQTWLAVGKPNTA